MFTSICILGRQPSLGLAELESLYGADSVQPVGSTAALIDRAASDIDFNRLGGSIKLAKVLTELQTTDWQELMAYIEKTLPKHLDYLPEGKMKFGLSAFDLSVSTQQINRSTLSIKKVIKAAGRSVRVVPNQSGALNSAQVLHNQLTSPLGMELLLIRSGRTTILAQTAQEQDIDLYAARDHGRPKRDAQVGMLPPKLAQIIINLAHPPKDGTVLDPFCGTGVVLQEALLMGYGALGTDLESRMIDYSKTNLEWLETNVGDRKLHYLLDVGDATSFNWDTPYDVVACESYLGRPFSSQPTAEVLREVMQDVDTIHNKFFRNMTAQTPSEFRLCIALPSWKTSAGFLHLKVLDSLEELGYTRLKFVHAKDEDLIYHRQDQIVARELVILQRI